MTYQKDSQRLLRLLMLLLVSAPITLPAQSGGEEVWEPAPLRVEFTPEGGFLEDSVAVQLLSPGALIYYTVDGSRPTASEENRYRGPVPIRQTTVIRAFAIVAGRKSKVFSQTYFLREPETSIPTISLSTTSDMLFDPEIGLFVRGPNAIDSLWHLPGANFWSRREISANFEWFEPDGTSQWADQVGLRLFGGMSRIFPQKSVQVVARSRYGESRVRHPVFGKKGLRKFKYLVFRNSGSDFGRSHFRDALITSLARNWHVDIQDYQPAHCYINGQYWGIYNVREKINRYYFAGHYGVDSDSIDLIEHRVTLRNGSLSHYRNLVSYIQGNDLSDNRHYAEVCRRMDVNSFIDLQIAQIYVDNQDAGGNIKFWRPQTPDGRWRWVLYDTDWGFGLNGSQAYRNNSLAFHTEPNGPHWPNPPWSTLLLRKLLANDHFRETFINRFADYLNTDLSTGHVLARIDSISRMLSPEIPRHLERWRLSLDRWESEVEVLRTFARERPAYMWQFLSDHFQVGAPRKLALAIDGGGRVQVNENLEVRQAFQGSYFPGVPVRLRAVPDLGHRFVRWEGKGVASSARELVLDLSKMSTPLKAVFEKHEDPFVNRVIINEISCNNKRSRDWVEILNRSDRMVNLENWMLTDRNHTFRFPAYTLPPGGYVVVCEDSARFISLHPQVQTVIGGLSFGLNKRRETIELFSAEGSAVDSTGYELLPSDSVFTLNLLLPHLDNGDPSNWELTPGTGTPAAANAYYLLSSIQFRRDLFLQIGLAAGVLVLGLLMLWLRRKRFL